MLLALKLGFVITKSIAVSEGIVCEIGHRITLVVLVHMPPSQASFYQSRRITAMVGKPKKKKRKGPRQPAKTTRKRNLH